MIAASLTARRVRDALLDTIGTFDVPGGQLAWLCDGQVDQVAWGSVRLGRPDAVSARTCFPLGSAVKVFTASLALQLVSDEALSLDGPIGPSLPPGRCREVLGDVSLRQLLTHTGGLENDHAAASAPLGSPREYVRACTRDLLLPPGEQFSYANAGYVVAGHLVEASAGQSWADQVQAFLLDPLDVRDAVFLDDPLRLSTVPDGHVRRADGSIAGLPRPALGREWAPAAGLALSARGVLGLVKLHLDGGRTPLGYPLLDPALADEMREPHVAVPDPGFASGWGLGWAMYGAGAGGSRWFGHDGEDNGWTTRVRASADEGFAIVMLANCLPARQEWSRLVAALASAGVHIGEPAVPEAPDRAPAIDPEVAGTYENGAVRLVVDQRDGGFWLTTAANERVPLRAVGDGDLCLVMPSGPGETPYAVAFLRDGHGRVRYLHTGGRTARRAAND